MVMAGLVMVGAVIGILFAHWATKNKRNFRKKILSELEKHTRLGTESDYVKGLLNFKAQWIKSLSLIRKPFKKQINLAIETAALVLSVMGLVTSIADFDRRFAGMLEGFAVVMFLGMVMAYIPSEWFFSGKIEEDIDSVMGELENAANRGKLDAYFDEAKKNWV